MKKQGWHTITHKEDTMIITGDCESLVLNTAGLSKALQIGKDKAYALMQSRGFPSTRLGHTYIVTRANLESWLAKYAGKDFIL